MATVKSKKDRLSIAQQPYAVPWRAVSSTGLSGAQLLEILRRNGVKVAQDTVRHINKCTREEAGDKGEIFFARRTFQQLGFSGDANVGQVFKRVDELGSGCQLAEAVDLCLACSADTLSGTMFVLIEGENTLGQKRVATIQAAIGEDRGRVRFGVTSLPDSVDYNQAVFTVFKLKGLPQSLVQ